MSKSAPKTAPIDGFREWVKEQFHQKLPPVFVFHNFSYAEEIEAELAKLNSLSTQPPEEDIIALQLAALSYCLGTIRLDPDEIRAQLTDKKAGKTSMVPNLAAYFLPHSVTILQDYLANCTEDSYFRRWATPAKEAKSNSSKDSSLHPVSLLQELQGTQVLSPAAAILTDATHSWFGRKRFSRRADLLSLESRALLGNKFDAGRFQKEIEERLLQHNYESGAAMIKYDARRRVNLGDQRDKVLSTEKVELRRKTGKDLGRGIDTLYRTAFKNHISLSQIADGKANMMISINTIILSILLAVSGAGIGFFQDLFFERPLMLLPIITLLLSSLTAVIFAVFSARPKVTEYRIKKKKLINSKEASLLYFGNFLKLEKEDFVQYMDNMKYRQDELYGDLSKDLYDLGAVLHRKYLLLTISYNTFVGGLALSVILFLLVYILKFL